MTFRPGTVLIVGAGFSANAGLPLASEFTTELLNIKGLKLDGPSARQVPFIRQFVDRTFGEGQERTPAQWPELEDIFTLVDLAANSGHHLGPHYPAAQLRTVRRAILARTIRMLDQAYARRERKPDAAWNSLEVLFREFDIDDASVLSMNWDTVVERGLARTQSVSAFDYGCDSRRAAFDGRRLKPKRGRPTRVAHILKPHGSTNWLYCDACREIFWVPPEDTQKVAQTIFRKPDWRAAETVKAATTPQTVDPQCPECAAKALGTRFATFSYRKALEFPMFAASWRVAERHLKLASDWVFFGYSMPPADYEFKHMLKRVQLTEAIRPRITVITGGEEKAATATIERYEKFFGTVSDERTYFRDGLDAAALDHLRSIQLLKTRSTIKR